MVYSKTVMVLLYFLNCYKILIVYSIIQYYYNTWNVLEYIHKYVGMLQVS